MFMCQDVRRARMRFFSASPRRRIFLPTRGASLDETQPIAANQAAGQGLDEDRAEERP